MKKLSLLLPGILISVFVIAQTPGTLDLSFGNNGITLTDYINNGDDNYSNASALQADGKIVLGGFSVNGSVWNITFVRYNADGTLDNTFGYEGIKVLIFGSDDQLTDLAVQPDGKIVFVGYTDNGTKTQMIAGRLNTDGSLDNSFNANGMTVVDFGPSTDSYGLAMDLLDDGKIIIVGYIQEDLTVMNIAMCRLASTGVPDNSFGVNGLITYDFNDLWCFPDNVVVYDEKILLGGIFIDGDDFMRYVTLSRYNLDGSVDYNFGNFGNTTFQLDEGFIAGPSYSDMCVAADGKIVYATHVKPAWLETDFAVVRFLQNGDIDNSFGNSGMVVTEMTGKSKAKAIVVQADGKILAAGYHKSPSPGSDDFVFVRYLGSGLLDLTFGTEGTGVVISNVSPETWFDDECSSLLLLDDGKVLASGYAKSNHVNPDFAIARYHTGCFVGIDKPVQNESMFTISPNPFASETKLGFKLSETKMVKVEVFNSSGLKVASLIHKVLLQGEHQFHWDANDFAPGIYFLKTTVGDNLYSEKIIKTK